MVTRKGPIVDAAWLLEHLVDVVIVDVRWYLDGRSGRDEYDKGHIGDAVFIDLDDELADPPSKEVGRHPLPSPERFAEAMGRYGIGDDTPVVVYDDAAGSVAARLWWMLRVLGHGVAVLDGGIQSWADAGYPLVTAPPAVRTRSFTARPWPDDRFVDIEAVDRLRLDPDALVLDARTVDRYRGEPHPVDPRYGHVPGAKSLPWMELVADGSLRPSDELRSRFVQLGADDATSVACYCGSGVTSCLDLLALDLAGFGDRGRLYTGSWSQWGADGSRPLQVGDGLDAGGHGP